MTVDPRQGRAWTALCERIYERDGRQCAVCGHTGDKSNPLNIDHIQPWSLYPELGVDPHNLQVLCRRHNLAKSNKTAAQRKRIEWHNPKWTQPLGIK